MNKPLSAQRARERALFLYSNALERGDFEAVSRVLKQAERDPLLERMIADLDAQVELPLDEPQAATRIVYKSDGIEQVITVRRPSSDGQTPESDHFEEDKNMIINTTQEYESFYPRPRATTGGMRWLTLIAAALVVLLMAVLTVIVFRAGFVSNPLMLGEGATPTPTPTPTPQVITRENVDQLELQDVFGYGTIMRLNWLPVSNRLLFLTNAGIVGFLNARSLDDEPALFDWHPTIDPTMSESTLSIAETSPDGTTLALANRNAIGIWDIETGVQRASIQSRFQRYLTFSPDGSLLIGGSSRGAITLWNAQTGEEVAAWVDSETPINSLSFSPDGTLLAAAYRDQNVRLWDMATGSVLATFEGHEDAVNTVSFSLDGNMIASGGSDGMIWLWDWRGATGTQHLALRREGSAISRVAYSPDSKLLASVNTDNVIDFWDVERVAKYGEITEHTDTIRSIVFSPDGTQLVSSSEDDTVRLWDVAELTEVKKTTIDQGHTPGVVVLQFNPAGDTLASGGMDNHINLWDVATGTVKTVLKGHVNPIVGVRFSPDGKLVASKGANGSDRTMRLWDAATGEELRVFDCAGMWPGDFSPDGRLLACPGGFDENALIFDVESGETVATLTGHVYFWGSILFTPDGKLAASTGDDRVVRLWDVATWTERAVLEGGHNAWVGAEAISPDGKMVASADGSGVIAIWDIATATNLKTFRAHTTYLNNMTFTRDSSVLITAAGDGAVKFWDTNTFDLIYTVPITTNPFDAAVSPDGKLLAIGDNGGTIWLYQVPPVS